MAGRNGRCARGGPGGPYECLMRGVGYGSRNAAAIRAYDGSGRGGRSDVENIPGIGRVFSARLQAVGITTRAQFVARLRRIAPPTPARRRDRVVSWLCGPIANRVVESSFDAVRLWLLQQAPPVTLANLTAATRARRCSALAPPVRARRAAAISGEQRRRRRN